MNLGAAIYQPENILKLPHVSFEGLVSGYKKNDVVITQVVSEEAFQNYDGKTITQGSTAGLFTEDDLRDIITNHDVEAEILLDKKMYAGAVYRRSKIAQVGTAMWEPFSKNTGHLGVLDDPEQVDRLHGMHKFTSAAVRV